MSLLLQITMTTVWLLLLLLVASSQSVDSQPTTDDEVCDGGQNSKLQQDVDTLKYNQQQILQQLQQIQLQHQTVVNRFGKPANPKLRK